MVSLGLILFDYCARRTVDGALLFESFCQNNGGSVDVCLRCT